MSAEETSAEQARLTLVNNERVKLTATLLNNTAIAAFVTSVVGPLVADLYGVSSPKSPYWWQFALCWIAGSSVLHFIARRTLGELSI